MMRNTIRSITVGVFACGLLSMGPPLPASHPAQDNPHLVVYEGTEGPGVGKHIVMIAGDHEYRSEEILPAMGRVLARRFGFKVSVFLTLDEEGFITILPVELESEA